MKKVLSILLVLSLTVSLFAGCSNDEQGQETANASSGESASTDSTNASDETEEAEVEPLEITLVFADGDAAAKESIYEIVDNYNESQKEFFVNIEAGNGGAYDEFLKTKESVGEFPDIVELRNPAQYVRADMIAPLTDEVNDLFTTTTDFYGEFYAAPLSAQIPQGIMYNKDYFEENDINENPQNWDEFIAICEQIQELGDLSPLVVGGNDLWHMGFWFSKIYTDEIITENPSFIANMYEGETTWSETPEARETFEKMEELFQYVDEGWGSTPDAMITTFLVTDMAAMMYSGTWMFSQIEEADPDFNMGWFPVPDEEGRLNMVGGAGTGGWALSKEALEADPRMQEAFDSFVKFFFSPEQYGIYTGALNLIPATKADPIMETTEIYDVVMDAVRKADLYMPMWNGRVGYDELPPDYRNFTYKVVVEVLQGSRSIDEALTELDKQWKISTQDFNPVTGEGLQ